MILFDLNHFDSIPQYTTFPIIFMASQSFHFSILSVALNFGYNIEFDTIWKYISKTTHFWLKLSILEENHHVKFWFVSLSNLMCPLENHRNFRVQYFPQWQSRNSRYGSPKFVSHRECDPYKSLTEKIFLSWWNTMLGIGNATLNHSKHHTQQQTRFQILLGGDQEFKILK